MPRRGTSSGSDLLSEQLGCCLRFEVAMAAETLGDSGSVLGEVTLWRQGRQLVYGVRGGRQGPWGANQRRKPTQRIAPPARQPIVL